MSEPVDLEFSDIGVLQAVADMALGYVRQGQITAGCMSVRQMFLLGKHGLQVMLARWCDIASNAIGQVRRNLRGPAWPLVNGQVGTDADVIDPPIRWAGRYIAAYQRGDLAMLDDLYDSCAGYQLAQGIEAVLLLTAAWLDHAEGNI